MARNAVHQLAACIGGVILTLGMFGCQPSPVFVTGRPECPRDFILIPRDDSTFEVVTEVAGSGDISLIPEYHDCQRMLTPEQTSYGPLIAVFARKGLDTMPDPQPPQGPPTELGYFAAEQAAATIFNYDRPYEPLHILSRISCLYLYAQGVNWTARIINNVADDDDCLKPFDPLAGGTQLDVTVIPDKNVPAVARWDWDSEHRMQYIGMRCGTQWCEVSGPHGQALVSSPQYAGPPKVHVKGWYDEQVLAVNGTSGGLSVVPGGVVGTIFPIGDLELNREEDFLHQWKAVARVSLSAPSPAYLLKFNFVAGPPPGAQSEISMCKGTRAECLIAATEPIKQCDQKEDDSWWAKVVSGEVTQYHCVIRRKHDPSILIPGVVRWRWQNEDDDIWVRCPEGCCEIT